MKASLHLAVLVLLNLASFSEEGSICSAVEYLFGPGGFDLENIEPDLMTYDPYGWFENCLLQGLEDISVSNCNDESYENSSTIFIEYFVSGLQLDCIFNLRNFPVPNSNGDVITGSGNFTLYVDDCQISLSATVNSDEMRIGDFGGLKIWCASGTTLFQGPECPAYLSDTVSQDVPYLMNYNQVQQTIDDNTDSILGLIDQYYWYFDYLYTNDTSDEIN